MELALTVCFVLLAALGSGVIGSALWEAIRSAPKWASVLIVVLTAAVTVAATVAVSAKFIPGSSEVVMTAALQPSGALTGAKSVHEVEESGLYQIAMHWNLDKQNFDPSTMTVTVRYACLAPERGDVPDIRVGSSVVKPISHRTTGGNIQFWHIQIPGESVSIGSGEVLVGPLRATRSCFQDSDPAHRRVLAGGWASTKDFEGNIEFSDTLTIWATIK